MPDQDFSVQSMAQSIARDLLGTLGPYGASILLDVLPPASLQPTYFDQSYNLVSSFVGQTISQDDRTAISGAINSVKQWLTSTYGPLKADPSSTPESLQASVQPMAEQMFANVIQPLMSSQRAQPGLSVFVLAAGVHLALVQEQAYTDPMHLNMGGVDSPFATSVKEYAQQYHDFITTTWAAMQVQRANAVSTPQVFSRGPDPVSGFSYSLYQWTDSMTGTTDDVVVISAPGPALQQSTADRATFIANALAAFQTTVPVDFFAANFLQLVNSPIPPLSAKILSLSASRIETNFLNTDGMFIPKSWLYSLSWSTSGGKASFDGVGNVAASGQLSCQQERFPANTLTVTEPGGRKVIQAIDW